MAASPLAPASPFTSAGMSREWKTIMEAALGPTWERMVNDTTIRPLFNGECLSLQCIIPLLCTMLRD